MYIFLSYAREDHPLAERVRSVLTSAGFECFLDSASLPPGQEFNARIGRAVDRADLFIVLLSAAALEPGSYVMTELSFAERKWRNPAGYVLPVAAADIDYSALPAYLAPINVFRPRGNVEAEILAWVHDRVERGGGGGEQTPSQRLEQWRRLHQPPLRRQRRFPARMVVLLFGGLLFIAFGVVVSNSGAPAEAAALFQIAPTIVGGGLIIYSIVLSIRGILGAGPVAALVLDRSETKHGVRIHLLLEGDRRRSVVPVGGQAASVYPGEIGWAFIASGMLLGFERA